MKFIHTSDWHLGNSLHNIDRTREARAFLQWLKEQIEQRGAQALIVAGDIFDVVNPPNTAKAQYYDFLAALRKTSCQNVVIIGGNHDSGALLDAPAELLSAVNIKVVGSINNRTAAELVCPLKDARGEIIAICCALPFIRDPELEQFGKNNNLIAPQAEAKAEEPLDLLKALYAETYRLACEIRGERDIPIIATGHLYAGDLSGHDAEEKKAEDRTLGQDDGVRDIIGTLGRVAIDTFPEGLDYVALGHIHYASCVAQNPKVRYSGSPFVLGFDEANYKRYILAVESTAHALPQVEKIEVPRTIRFEQLKGDLAAIKKALNALEKELLETKEETYVDILLTSGETLNLAAALEAEEKDKHFTVKRHRLARNILAQNLAQFDEAIESTKQYSAEDYFKMLIAREVNAAGDSPETEKYYEHFIGLFKEAVDRAHQKPEGQEQNENKEA